MSPEEDRSRDAVDSEPKHYQLSYSAPQKKSLKSGSHVSHEGQVLSLIPSLA